MLILTNTTDKIEINLGFTVSTQLDCLSFFNDNDSSSLTPNRNVTQTNNLNYIDLVGSPASSKQRIINYISIYNSNSGISQINILFNQNGTRYILYNGILNNGEKLEYNSMDGFKVLSSIGSDKNSTNIETLITDNGIKTHVLQRDSYNNKRAFSWDVLIDVTGLSFPVVANKSYWFKFFVIYSVDATTVGLRFVLKGSDMTFISYTSNYGTSTTALRTIQGIVVWETNAASPYQATPGGTVGSSSSSPATTGNTAIIEGIISTKEDGEVLMMTSVADFGSSPPPGEFTTQGMTVLKGSFVQYQLLN